MTLSLELAAELYAGTFAGQREAYSVFNGDHWQAVREPLTHEVVLRAFATNVPISGYVMGPDSATHIAALDIDRDDGYELGIRFMKRLADLGGVGYVERSARGCHTWSILDERLPAIVIRRGLKAIASEAGLPDDPKIELRPASDRLSQSSTGQPPLGHCIRMATMPHHRTGKRYPLIDPDRTKLSGKLALMVEEVEVCPAAVFKQAAERAPMPPLEAPPLSLRYPFGVPEGDESASDILRSLWGVRNARPGRSVRCPAHDDRHASLSILRDDQRAICKAATCDLNNGDRGRGTHELRTMAPGR